MTAPRLRFKERFTLAAVRPARHPSQMIGLRRLLTAACPFVSCLLSVSAQELSPLDYWTWSNPQVTGNNLAAIAYGNGRYVTVGNWGTVLVSTDGESWQNRSLPISAVISSLTFGKGMFVAAAHDGMHQNHGDSTAYIMVSPDGENWVPVYSRTNPVLYGRTETLNCLRYLNGRFVAVGGNTSFVPRERSRWIMSSEDGINWTDCVRSTNTYLLSVSCLNGKYVAVGETSTVLLSTDSQVWTEPATNTLNQFFPHQWVDIISHGGRLLVLANTSYYNNPSAVFASADGESWSLAGNISDYALASHLVPYGSRLLACGETGKSFVSDDGTSWSDLPLPESIPIYGASSINGETFALGAAGYLFRGTDGQPWQTLFPRVSGFNPLTIAYGNGRFVAFSNFESLNHTSKDGMTWTALSNAVPAWVQKARFLNGCFFAVGGDEAIVISTNGLDWRLVHSAPGSGHTLYDVAWNGNVFAAFGTYSVGLISTNGMDWSPVSPGAFLSAVTAGDGVFVAASYNGQLLRSTDAVNWTTTLSTNNALYNDCAHGNGRFVFVDPNGRAWASTNGTDWTGTTLLENCRVRQVVFTGTCFVAATESAVIFSSMDGLTWRPHLPATPADYRVMAYGDDRIVLGGAGMLVVSDPLGGPLGTIRSLQCSPGKTVTLDIQAFPGSMIDLQTALHVGEWLPADEIYLPTGRACITLPANGDARFYRARPY